jgi:hypothetical protein
VIRSSPKPATEHKFGHPSVAFRVPILLDSTGRYIGTNLPVGYSVWDGRSGELHSYDSSITNSPGLGIARLVSFNLVTGLDLLVEQPHDQESVEDRHGG